MQRRTTWTAAALIAVGAAWGPVWAQPAATEAKAPAAEQGKTADEVLRRAIDAQWGEAAQSRPVKTLEMKAVFKMPAQGIEAPIHTWFDTEAGAMRLELEIPGLMKETQGVVDGKAWAESSINGPRVLSGDEAEQTLQQADFYADLDFETEFAVREYLGTEKVGGKTCDKVRLVREEGDDPEVRWYDTETGLLVKQSVKSKTQMGELEVVSEFSDYRPIEGAQGVKMPYTTTLTMAGMKQVIALESVTVNPEIPADRFTPPPAVQKLMG